MKKSRARGEILKSGYIFNFCLDRHSCRADNGQAVYQTVAILTRYRGSQKQIPCLIGQRTDHGFLALQILESEYAVIEIISEV